jgi:hypothetical protein
VKSYHLHASCYLKKPGTLNEFETLIKSFNRFWLTHVKLPGHARPRLAEQQATVDGRSSFVVADELL